MNKKILYAVAALVVITAAVILVFKVKSYFDEKNAPSEVVMPLSDYYSVPEGEAMVILDGDIYETNALWSDHTAYLDRDTVTAMYSHRFFYVEEENRIIYTTPDKIYYFTPGSRDYVLNGENRTSDVPVVLEKNGVLYIEVSFLKDCGITYRIYEDPARIMITYSAEDFLAAKACKATQIRTGRDIKADVLEEIAEGETVRYIDGGGIRENGFVKVMSADGVRGYIREDALETADYEKPAFDMFVPQQYTHLRRSDKVYLGWQLLYTTDCTGLLKNALDTAPELNVAAPTWFYLTGTEGDFISYANADYVRTAHDRGVEVWATFKNDTIDGKFSCTEDSHAVLCSTENREKLIANMLAAAEEYGFDGINIDFELLKVDSGVYFVEFLRELSVHCRAKGIVLSVDNYVPAGYNAYYDLKEQGEILDYIVIMGYDEHYAGSEEAGSVSSLSWFRDAISNTLDKAEAEGIIMGIPFYTRLWKETMKDGVLKVTVEATPNMADAAATVKSKEKTWKDAEGQYYVEYTSGSAIYKMWLEEEESIRAKVLAIREGELAGVAAWKLGDETKGTWSAIKDALEGELPEPEPEEENESENGEETVDGGSN